jgi:hypothetical protein
MVKKSLSIVTPKIKYIDKKFKKLDKNELITPNFI